MDPTLIELVRRRPGMYVGPTEDGSAIVHMVLELVGNAYDQHLAGRCTRVSIDVEADGTITVEDDGPGLPAGGSAHLPPLHQLVTQLSNLPTVDAHRPHIHLAVRGIGLTPINALCERFELRTVHDGIRATARYARGVALEPVTSVPTEEPSGTRIRFRPDPDLFLHPRVPRVALAARLDDLAFLSSTFTLRWSFAGDDLARHGLAGRIALAAPCRLAEVAHHRGEYETADGPVDVEVALAWRHLDAGADRDAELHSFVNLARTREDGSHVAGLKAGVASFFGGERVARTGGMVAAVAVMLADVRFGKPSRDELLSAHVVEPVRDATVTALARWAEGHPALVAALRARIAT